MKIKYFFVYLIIIIIIYLLITIYFNIIKNKRKINIISKYNNAIIAEKEVIKEKEEKQILSSYFECYKIKTQTIIKDHCILNNIIIKNKIINIFQYNSSSNICNMKKFELGFNYL
jgi:hypothetical protein